MIKWATKPGSSSHQHQGNSISTSQLVQHFLFRYKSVFKKNKTHRRKQKLEKHTVKTDLPPPPTPETGPLNNKLWVVIKRTPSIDEGRFSLAHLVTVDSKFPSLGKAKTSDSCFWWATVGPGRSDGVAHAAIRQPAGIAAVQVEELPCRVELTHLGNFSLVILARLLGFF